MQWIFRTALLLAVFWSVLSGHYTPLFLILAMLSIALVVWICWRAGFAGPDGVAWSVSPRLPLYLLWLGKEVLVSSITLARTVWAPRAAVRPVIDTAPAQDMSVVSQVVYANSITLTPGTVSLDVGDEEIEVHSLSAQNIKALHTGAMAERVRRLEARK
jgi:multicomponent Na+:H+ antiporter subunit E